MLINVQSYCTDLLVAVSLGIGGTVIVAAVKVARLQSTLSTLEEVMKRLDALRPGEHAEDELYSQAAEEVEELENEAMRAAEGILQLRRSKREQLRRLARDVKQLRTNRIRGLAKSYLSGSSDLDAPWSGFSRRVNETTCSLREGLSWRDFLLP